MAHCLGDFNLQNVFSTLKLVATLAMRVLMVCLGNICRSPMAEGARDLAATRGIELSVDSAGTYAGHQGEAPDLRAQEEMKEEPFHSADSKPADAAC